MGIWGGGVSPEGMSREDVSWEARDKEINSGGL